MGRDSPIPALREVAFGAKRAFQGRKIVEFGRKSVELRTNIGFGRKNVELWTNIGFGRKSVELRTNVKRCRKWRIEQRRQRSRHVFQLPIAPRRIN